MKLYTVAEDPIASPIQIWRQSPWSVLAGPLLVLAFAVALAIIILLQDLPPHLWILVGLLLIVALLTSGSVIAAFRRRNWIMKFDGSQIALKFRSWLDRRSNADTPVIATFDAREFASARKASQHWVFPSGNPEKHQTNTVTFLDLRLKDAATARELETVLENERRPDRSGKKGARTDYPRVPVRVVDSDVVRVSWKNPNMQVQPEIEETLRVLESALRIEDPHRAPDLNWIDIPDDRLHEIVHELTHMGRRIDATKVVIARTGLDPEAAKQFVDSIEGNAAPSGPARISNSP